MGEVITVLVVILLIVLGTARPFGGTRVSVADDELTVELLALDKVWGFRSRLVAPVGSVRDVRIAHRGSLSPGWRLPGTRIPGWIVSGRYVRSGQTSLWNVRRAPEVLVIDLEGQAFDQVVVEVDNPARVAAEVRSVVGLSGSSGCVAD